MAHCSLATVLNFITYYGSVYHNLWNCQLYPTTPMELFCDVIFWSYYPNGTILWGNFVDYNCARLICMRPETDINKYDLAYCVQSKLYKYTASLTGRTTRAIQADAPTVSWICPLFVRFCVRDDSWTPPLIYCLNCRQQGSHLQKLEPW